MNLNTTRANKRVEVTRATFYPAETDAGGASKSGVIPLAITSLGVDADVVVIGRVTLFRQWARIGWRVRVRGRPDPRERATSR